MLRNRNLIPLSHQHQHGLALCVQLDRGLPEDASAEIVAAKARAIGDHFRSELNRHFDAEEKFLFPAAAHLAELAPLVAELLEEHSFIKGLAHSIEAQASRPLLLEFSGALRNHIRKEETLLFERVQQLLSHEELESVGALLANALR